MTWTLGQLYVFDRAIETFQSYTFNYNYYCSNKNYDQLNYSCRNAL